MAHIKWFQARRGRFWASLLLALLLGAGCRGPVLGNSPPTMPARMPSTVATQVPTAQGPAPDRAATPSANASPSATAAGTTAPPPMFGTAKPSQVRPAVVLDGHTGPVTALAWSPDGRVLASSSGDFQGDAPVDRTVRLWSASGYALAVLGGHAGKVYALAWSPDGQLLASGSAGGTVRLWNAAGQEVRVLAASSDPVYALAWSPDGRFLASGATHFESPGTPATEGILPGIVRLWRPDGTLEDTLSTQYTGGKFYNLAWSPDGKLLAGGAVDYRIWRPDGTLSATIPGCPRCTPAWAMAWFPDSQKLAIGDESGNLSIYDTAGKLLDLTRQWWAAGVAGNGITADVNQLAFSPDGKLLAIGSLRPRLVPLADLEGVRELASAQVPLAWSPDSHTLATSTKQGSALLWGSDGALLAVLQGCQGATRALAWSPNGQILAAGTEEAKLCFWQPPAATGP